MYLGCEAARSARHPDFISFKNKIGGAQGLIRSVTVGSVEEELRLLGAARFGGISGTETFAIDLEPQRVGDASAKPECAIPFLI